MVTWTLIILLTLGAYAFKVTGLVFLGGRSLPPIFERCLALIPAAVVTALVMKDTFTNGQDLVLDARALGIAVAGIAAWRKAPLIVVIVLGAAVTALVRQI
ncbi:MAG: AzlD domain-containing protein [Actinobacteria bacterium]|nr:AzlD domain-containing protein [Actinomycetota bacterium]